eukprot:g3852.t1
MATNTGPSQPLRIDTHTHILPQDWPRFKKKFGYGGFIQLDHHVDGWARMMKDDGTFFREVEADLWSAEDRLEYMNNTGIDVQVCCTVPVMFSYFTAPEDGLEVCKFLNDDLSNTVRKNPARFVGLGTLPMQAPELAVKEARRCVKELGLAGFQIGSHIEQRTLDDGFFFPIFQELERLGACLMVHPWDMMGKGLLKKFWLPWLVSMPAETSAAICSFIFGGIFERLPNLRVMFAHAGGSFPATIGRIQHGFECRPDLCAVENKVPPISYLGKFWIDHLTHSKTQLKYVIDLIGENSICFGTDYPFPLGETYPLKKPAELIDSLSKTAPSVKEKLLGMNAIMWLFGQGSAAMPALSENGMRMLKMFRGSPHRSSKISEKLIIAKFDESLSGQYKCGDAVLHLGKDGKFTCGTTGVGLPTLSEHGVTDGNWIVGTYNRFGKPNSDIILIVMDALPSHGGSLRQRSEWTGRLTVKVVLDMANGSCAEVDKFKFENLKRSSGHNTLLERQVDHEWAAKQAQSEDVAEPDLKRSKRE